MKRATATLLATFALTVGAGLPGVPHAVNAEDCSQIAEALRVLISQEPAIAAAVAAGSAPASALSEYRRLIAIGQATLNQCVAGNTDPQQPDIRQPQLPDLTTAPGFAPGFYNPEAFIAKNRSDWAAFRARSQQASAFAAPAITQSRSGPLAAVALPPLSAAGARPETGALKLCWQLFSRTDCTDQQAAALYQRRSQPIIDQLQAELSVVAAQRAQWERNSKLYEESLKSKQVERVVSALRDDHKLVMTARDEAIGDAMVAILGAVPSTKLNNASAASMYLRDAPAVAAMLGQKAGSGERWTSNDTEAVANLATGLATDLTGRALEGTAFAAKATFVGRGIAAGQAAIALAKAGAAEYALQQIDAAILKPTESIDEHRNLLAGLLLSNQLRSEDLARQLRSRQEEVQSILQYAR